MSNRELAEELHRPINIKFEKQKLSLSFIDNIRGADVADMQLINLIIEFVFPTCHIFSESTWVVQLNNKKKGYCSFSGNVSWG